MGYLRLSCSVAAMAGTIFLGVAIPAQAAPTSAKAKASRTAATARPAIVGQLQLVHQRKSITQLTAKELQSLRKGMAQMIAWNSAPRGSANFKRSLRYWANMHAYIGTGCSPASGLNNPGMSGISLQSKTTPDENATWCTCQHGTIQFLTWHRMYLYYFEQVLRAASGDPSLELPYWDYETDGHIPAAYRSPTYVSGGQTLPNPLYIANRQAQLNDGTAALTPAVVSTSGAMPATSYSPFNSALEQTPHGSVHCATGVASCPSGYMGYVPTAGNDPIFYSHHANIDRLYECWLKVNPAQRLPSGAMLNTNFSFIDGTGTLVSRKVGDMLTVQQLGYSYASGGGCPRVRAVRPGLQWDAQPRKVVPLLGPTALRRGTTRLPVRVDPEASARPATLVLEGLAFDEAPGVMYEVALQGPDGKRVTLGVINFFNKTAPRHDHAGMEGDVPAAPERATFDATEALQTLGGTANAQLVLQPTTGVTGGLTGDAVELVNERANVRFSAARIEVR